jgi:pentatricopeptide repeat protein
MEMQSVAKLLALKFVRGCEKNRDMQALETFLTKHPHYIVPGDIYSAVVKAIANAYVPPLRKPTETDEERGWIDSLESGDHPSTRDGGGVAEKGENKRQQQGEKGDWLYTQAWALFHEMPRHGIARSKDVYDAMIELACKRASIKRALALFREMQHEAEREQREVRGFTHRTARTPHAATHTLFGVVQSGKTTLKPGLRTYRSLIVHCLNNNYFNKEEEYNYRNDINHPLTQRAFQLFEEMEGASASFLLLL